MDKSKVVMAAALAALLLIGLPVSYSAGRKSAARDILLRMKTAPIAATAEQKTAGVPISREQFQQIQPGMTLDQVEAALGRAGELFSQSHSAIGGQPFNLDTYEWKWAGGRPLPSSIAVGFKNGLVDHMNYRD